MTCLPPQVFIILNVDKRIKIKPMIWHDIEENLEF